MPSAEIITIGTELLLGETTDTNTRFIARTLRGLGLNLYRTQTVGDNVERIAAAVREAAARVEIVITTGGLGPTVDDPTRQAVANGAGVPLEFHQELWEQTAKRISRYGRVPGENQKRQAYLPQGAIAIENPVGTAPAFMVALGRAIVISLPGVPREMETLLIQSVVPYLQERYDLHEIIKVRTLHSSGIGEGTIDEQVADLETLSNPTVGLTAHSGIVDIRITVKAGTEIEADRMIAEIEQKVRSRLPEAIYGIDDDTLEGVTLRALAERGWTIACLESGLEGKLLQRISREGHSAYRGGRSLQVAPQALRDAAEGLRRELDASSVLGVVLSPAGEGQVVDLVLQTPLDQEIRHLSYGGHPANAPRWAVNMALDWLRRQVQTKG
ncbi:MAG: CinA family nicotinamide mononucleotide deamidase-related protein [Anaerolineales bacterium]|jgi:competence/damage-inducible protein CinA-like protein